jgi:hypothetical protein
LAHAHNYLTGEKQPSQKNVFAAKVICIIFDTRYDKHKTYNEDKTGRLAELTLSFCINDSNAFRQNGRHIFY